MSEGAAGVKRNGVLIGARKLLNFIEGTNITITITETENQINITINST